MKVIHTELPGVLIVEPAVFHDQRGSFLESYVKARYEQAGIKCEFVQDNTSVSGKGVLRGLHFQYPSPQAKLITVTSGQIFDVAVDIRRGSPTFLKWVGMILSATNHHQLFIPKGFAHGFLALTDGAVVDYMMDDYYDREADRALLWSDPAIGIKWPGENPILSQKDASAPRIADIDPALLPPYIPAGL